MSRSSPASHWAVRLLMLLGATLLALLGVELVFRVQGLDRQAINQNLDLQGSDLAVYQVAQDPFLVYETRPGATEEGHGITGIHHISIDGFGARGAAHPEQKASGTTRIFFFGASTVFGANVNDEQTIPAVLEQELNRRAAPGSAFEVWNFACSGYMLPQLLRRARNQLARFPDVDILLLMNTNSGRRLFLGAESLQAALDMDRLPLLQAEPSLILENFPPDPALPESLYLLGMKSSAAIRTLVGRRQARHQQPKGSSPYSAALDASEHTLLQAEAAANGAELVFAFYPRRNGAARGYLPFLVPESHAVDLQAASDDPLFYEIHPPPAYLAQHAAALAQGLADKGLVALAPSAAPPGPPLTGP